jgi:AmmeMemoRadiSam system protein B
MGRSVTDVRPSPLAGKWYPGNAEALTVMLDGFLDAVQLPVVKGRPMGLLAPHAGLKFSGPVAAHSYAFVRDMVFDTVVVIGPMHHPIPGSVLTSAHSHYETPLGCVPIDRGVLYSLGRSIPLTELRDDPEHSVEIELPFLQRVLKPGFSLVPIMLRDQSLKQAQALGQALATLLNDRKVLIVASSDLSHFYKQEIANKLDKIMLNHVGWMDAERVIDCNERGTAFACGAGAIATVICALQALGADRAQIVGYGTSGDVTGDLERVVGYGAAMFWDTD